MSESEKDPVATFSFKRKSRKQIPRKRKASSEERSSDEESGSAVVRKDKTIDLKNPLITRTRITAGNRHRKASDSSSDGGGKASVSYKAKRSAKRLGPDDMGATATIDIDTALDEDAQATFLKAKAINESLKDKADDGVYRGLNNYQTFIEKKDTAQGNAASGHVRKGPMRAPANLRSTVRWDYQPDVCKDYKETGFCGFGDSCKFMHDRGDYKHGWQLEREELNPNEDNDDDKKYEIDSDEEDVPFKCLLCRQSFKDPIITKCRHYFCESCALTHYRKSKRCFVCNQQTMGIFNPAKDVIAKIKKMKEEEEKQGEDEESDGDIPPPE